MLKLMQWGDCLCAGVVATFCLQHIPRGGEGRRGEGRGGERRGGGERGGVKRCSL